MTVNQSYLGDVQGRYVKSPPVAAGVRLRLAMKAAGIRQTGSVTAGPAPKQGRLLATVKSPRLKTIVAAIRDLALGNWSGEGRLRLSRADAAGLVAFETALPDTIWRGGERVREMGRRLGAVGGIPPAVTCSSIDVFTEQLSMAE